MSASNWKTTPTDNIMIGAYPLGEGMVYGQMVNNIIQQMMAEVALALANVPVAGDMMPKTGGAFEGDITRQSAGKYLHHAGDTMLSGVIHTQPVAAALPSPSEGMIVLQY